MSGPVSSAFKVAVSDKTSVTVKVDAAGALGPHTAAVILAHGANNDLDYPLLTYLGSRLAETTGAMVVRFNFPYMERGASSPDRQGVLETAFARVHDHVVDELIAPGAPVFVGGKSLGGRVAAELVSRGHEGEGLFAAGLIVLGYPLHAPGHKEHLHLEPLRRIGIPSLFCVGSRDPLCDPELLRPALAGLVYPGELFVVKEADHSLRLPRSSGRRPDDAYEAVTEEIAGFTARIAGWA